MSARKAIHVATAFQRAVEQFASNAVTRCARSTFTTVSFGRGAPSTALANEDGSGASLLVYGRCLVPPGFLPPHDRVLYLGIGQLVVVTENVLTTWRRRDLRHVLGCDAVPTDGRTTGKPLRVHFDVAKLR